MDAEPAAGFRLGQSPLYRAGVAEASSTPERGSERAAVPTAALGGNRRAPGDATRSAAPSQSAPTILAPVLCCHCLARQLARAACYRHCAPLAHAASEAPILVSCVPSAKLVLGLDARPLLIHPWVAPRLALTSDPLCSRPDTLLARIDQLSPILSTLPAAPLPLWLPHLDTLVRLEPAGVRAVAANVKAASRRVEHGENQVRALWAFRANTVLWACARLARLAIPRLTTAPRGLLRRKVSLRPESVLFPTTASIASTPPWLPQLFYKCAGRGRPSRSCTATRRMPRVTRHLRRP